VAKPKRAEQPQPGHHHNDKPHIASELLPCLVIRATADGYVVGRGLCDAGVVEWLSPTHVREWMETRPKDIVLTAEKWANEDGSVTLKPKRVARGTPVPTLVGHHIAFGESMDAAALRANGELRKQFDAMVRNRISYWRHLCGESLQNGLPLWLGTPRGESCRHCGAEEPKPKARVA
jgi:hypothetical protein